MPAPKRCEACQVRPTPPRTRAGGAGPRYCLACAKAKGQRWDRTLRRLAERDGPEAAAKAALEGGVELPSDLAPPLVAEGGAPIVLEDATGDMKGVAHRTALALDLISQHLVAFAQRGDVAQAQASMLTLSRGVRAMKHLPGGVRQTHADVTIVFEGFDD